MSIFSRLLEALGIKKKSQQAQLPLFESTLLALLRTIGDAWHIEASSDQNCADWLKQETEIRYLSFYHGQHGKTAWLIHSSKPKESDGIESCRNKLAASLQSILKNYAAEDNAVSVIAGYCSNQAKSIQEIKAFSSKFPAVKLFSCSCTSIQTDSKFEFMILIEELCFRYIRRNLEKAQKIDSIPAPNTQASLEERLLFKHAESYFLNDIFVPNIIESNGLHLHCHPSSAACLGAYKLEFGESFKVAGFKSITQSSFPVEWCYVIYGNWNLPAEQVLEIMKASLKQAIANLHTFLGIKLGRLSFAPSALPQEDASTIVTNYRLSYEGASSPGLAVCIPHKTIEALFGQNTELKPDEAQVHPFFDLDLRPLLQMNERLNAQTSFTETIEALNLNNETQLSLTQFLMALGPADTERCLSAFIGLGHGLSDLFGFFIQAYFDPRQPEKVAYYQQDASFDHSLFVSRLGQRWQRELLGLYSSYDKKIIMVQTCTQELVIKQKQLMVGLYHFIKKGRLLLAPAITELLYSHFELPFEKECLEQAKALSYAALLAWQNDKKDKSIQSQLKPAWFLADESLIKRYEAFFSEHDKTAIEDAIRLRRMRIKDGLLVLPNYQLLEEILQE